MDLDQCSKPLKPSSGTEFCIPDSTNSPSQMEVETSIGVHTDCNSGGPPSLKENACRWGWHLDNAFRYKCKFFKNMTELHTSSPNIYLYSDHSEDDTNKQLHIEHVHAHAAFCIQRDKRCSAPGAHCHSTHLSVSKLHVECTGHGKQNSNLRNDWVSPQVIQELWEHWLSKLGLQHIDHITKILSGGAVGHIRFTFDSPA